MPAPSLWSWGFVGLLGLLGWPEGAARGQVAGEPYHRPEAIEMIAGILDGTAMRGQGHGWFHPAQIRHGWDWLANERDGDRNGAVTPSEWLGSDRDFARLDRNHDRAIKPDDFDWSENALYLRQGEFFRYHFRKIDADHDGRVTQPEWDGFFARISDGKDHLTVDDFREAWIVTPPPMPLAALLRSNPFQPSAEWAIKRTLITGLARSEIGSVREGPALGAVAPDFTLATRDGSRRITLSEVVGRKPVVLVFGNYTCGPFRRQFPQIDDIARRYADRAEFLMVYVREAHPTDGWRMDDNDEVGIALDQPTDYAGRVAVADRCGQALKPSMPVLVDTMTDQVGHLYSGMPSRLYVIDPSGRITYKAGRGPYGLRPGEMEQLLILTLQANPTTPSTEPKPE